MNKKIKKIAGRIKKFFIFVDAKVNQTGVKARNIFGYFYTPQPYSGVVSRGRESSPSDGALAARSASLFCRNTNAKKTSDMNISPEELEQIKAEAERITIDEDPYLEVWAMVDPLKYRDLLLAIPN